MKFINIGYNNMVAAERIVAVVGYDSAPAKRLAQDAKDDGRAIDATCGRRTRSVIITDSDHVILSAVSPESITARATETSSDTADSVEGGSQSQEKSE
ncbi:MAG TPA: DUF370 domain-containing protein [Bacillota bacterium]|nr:DUF370 domain-containing protein [Clostridiales bacterium]HOQ14507.1 DUF370 domain-containing protein [Bacillota bacterium]HPU17053.1 DUF370 domain-containing protein [Bacillota bacterium]